MLTILLSLLIGTAQAGDIVSKGVDGGISVTTGTFDNLCVNGASGAPGTCSILKVGRDSTTGQIVLGNSSGVSVTGTVTAAALVASTLTINTNTLVTSGASVGIGVTSPGAMLQVGNNSTGNGIRIDMQSLQNFFQYYINGALQWTQYINGNDLVFGDNSADRVKIARGGTVTINTSTFTVASSGIITAPSQPYVQSAENSGGDVIPNNVDTQLFYQAPAAGDNPQNMWGGVLSSGTFTIPAGGGGLYLIDAQMFLQSASAQRISIFKNASSFASAQMDLTANSNNMQIHRSLRLVAGDTIQIFGFQNSGSNKTTIGNNLSSSFVSITKLW